MVSKFKIKKVKLDTFNGYFNLISINNNILQIRGDSPTDIFYKNKQSLLTNLICIIYDLFYEEEFEYTYIFNYVNIINYSFILHTLPNHKIRKLTLNLLDPIKFKAGEVTNIPIVST